MQFKEILSDKTNWLTR